MNREEKIIVGISIGDLNGIGSEIIIKTYEDPRSLELNTPVIFASGKTMQFFKNSCPGECTNHLGCGRDGQDAGTAYFVRVLLRRRRLHRATSSAENTAPRVIPGDTKILQ